MRNLLIIFCSLFIAQNATAQIYVTDESLEKTVLVQDNELKILYFTAVWCGPCKMMAPVMASIDADPKIPVSIYKLDTDSNKADNVLKVRSIPTYYFIKNGVVLGTSGGAKSKSAMEKLIQKHDAMPVKGAPLAYPGKPSKYKIIAGTNSQLTKERLEPFWYETGALNELSWKIYENSDDNGDLLCALNLVDRSIELTPFSSNLETRAHVLYKLGRIKDAKKAAQTARDFAFKNGESTAIIDTLIEQMTTKN